MWSHRGTVEELALSPGETAALGDARSWVGQNRVTLVSHWPIVCHSLRVDPLEGGSIEKLRPQ